MANSENSGAGTGRPARSAEDVTPGRRVHGGADSDRQAVPVPAAEAPTATAGSPPGPAPGLSRELGDEAGQGYAGDEAGDEADEGGHPPGGGLPGAAGGGLIGG